MSAIHLLEPVAKSLAAVLLALSPAQETVRFTGTVPAVFDSGWNDAGADASSPFHRAGFTRQPYKELIEDGQINTVATRLVDELRASPWGQDHEDVKAKILRHLASFLFDLRAALAAPGIEGPLDMLEEQEAFLIRLREQGRALNALTLRIAPDGRPVYFSALSADPADWLYLYEEAGTNPGGDTLYETPVPERQMTEWRLLESALTNLVTQQIRLVSAKNVADLREAVAEWERYLDEGYSMYPWEALLNGYALELPPEGPPDRQWILLHPTLGLEVAAGSLDDVRIQEALVMELLGHLWYSDDFRNFYGLSVTTSLREDIDPGLGVLLHIRRNWNLGVSWHSVEDDPFVFFSVDLFRFVSSEVKEHRKRYDRLREKLSSL